MTKFVYGMGVPINRMKMKIKMTMKVRPTRTSRMSQNNTDIVRVYLRKLKFWSEVWDIHGKEAIDVHQNISGTSHNHATNSLNFIDGR